MDKDFAIIMYNAIREFQVRFQSDKAMNEEESLFYMQHLRTATKHAKMLELALNKRIAEEYGMVKE